LTAHEAMQKGFAVNIQIVGVRGHGGEFLTEPVGKTNGQNKKTDGA